MDIFPPEAWQRLGKALERRRGQLGYGFRRRTEFAEGSGLSAKTLARLEKAQRSSYPDDTLALVEVIYKWEPGSVQSVLAGGEPALSPGSPGNAEPAALVLDPEIAGIMAIPHLSGEEKRATIGLLHQMRADQAREDEQNGGRRSNG